MQTTQVRTGISLSAHSTLILRIRVQVFYPSRACVFVNPRSYYRDISAQALINFSAASRPNACFLLVAAPPLKVFRRPCASSPIVSYQCTSDRTQNEGIVSCPTNFFRRARKMRSGNETKTKADRARHSGAKKQKLAEEVESEASQPLATRREQSQEASKMKQNKRQR